MAPSSLQHHTERSHGILLPQVRGVDVGGGGPEIYKVLFPRILKLVECPVEGRPERAKPPGRLRDNFMYRHWKSKVSIMQEGTEPLPQCYKCGMHMPAANIFKHRKTDKCNKATERRTEQRDVEMAERCGEMEFSLEGGEGDERVENMKTFWYLGSPLYQTDGDWLTVWRNIMCTRSVLGRLGTLL